MKLVEHFVVVDASSGEGSPINVEKIVGVVAIVMASVTLVFQIPMIRKVMFQDTSAASHKMFHQNRESWGGSMADRSYLCGLDMI